MAHKGAPVCLQGADAADKFAAVLRSGRQEQFEQQPDGIGVGRLDFHLSLSLSLYVLTSCAALNPVMPTRQASGRRSLRPDRARTADTPESRV